MLISSRQSKQKNAGGHTAIATTKFLAIGLNLQMRDTASAVTYDTINWTTNIKGMTPSSISFSALSCDANLVKTATTLLVVLW